VVEELKQTVAAHEESLEESALAFVVSTVVALLAKRRFFGRKVRAWPFVHGFLRIGAARMKVIVFTHEHYGLFFYDHFLELAGIPTFG